GQSQHAPSRPTAPHGAHSRRTRGLPVQAIVTLGPSLAASQFTPPPNVTLETFIPHAAVLPYVGAMVMQCGLGTVMKVLAHGVPLVCLPLVSDQLDNAARVVA